jgi:RNA polymerase sigma-70 factor (ECF subfamily)
MDLTWKPDRLQEISDAELVQRAQDGRSGTAPGVEAVAELYNRYHENIFHYIWSKVSDPHLAEDLTGDVFLRMVTNLPKYRTTAAPFPAWLFRIARNLVIDHARKAGTHKELPIDNHTSHLKDDGDSLSDIVDQNFSMEQVRVALQELNSLRQEVLILRFFVGMSLNEVASLLGKTVGSIKVAQHRAINELREILEPEVGE